MQECSRIISVLLSIYIAPESCAGLFIYTQYFQGNSQAFCTIPPSMGPEASGLIQSDWGPYKQRILGPSLTQRDPHGEETLVCLPERGSEGSNSADTLTRALGLQGCDPTPVCCCGRPARGGLLRWPQKQVHDPCTLISVKAGAPAPAS